MSSTPQGAWRARRRSRRALAGIGCALAMCVAAGTAQADGWSHQGHHGTRLITGSLLLSTSEYAPAGHSGRRHPAAAGMRRRRPPAPAVPRWPTATYPFVVQQRQRRRVLRRHVAGVPRRADPLGSGTSGRFPVPDDQFVTSFSSKSELALNLSPEGKYVSFMGYDAQPAEVDVSNANTPGVFDPGNGDVGPYYRVVAQLDRSGHWTFTQTNAYSGDNGRAAITNDERGQDLIYAAGNAGQSNSPPPGVVQSTRRAVHHAVDPPGGRSRTPARRPRSGASTSPSSATRWTRPPRTTTTAASRSTTTSSTTRRAVAATASTRCTSSTRPARRARRHRGLPQPGAQLPTSAPIVHGDELRYHGQAQQRSGAREHVRPRRVPHHSSPGPTPTRRRRSSRSGCGSPTTTRCTSPMRAAATTHTRRATDSTRTRRRATSRMPVSRSGCSRAVSGPSPTRSRTGWTWVSRTRCPGTRPATTRRQSSGLPWAPATDGLRQLTGRVNPDGTATIWAITSTVSGGGDQGADPNKLVAIDRSDSAATPPGTEYFRTVRTAHARRGLARRVVRAGHSTAGLGSDDRW